MVQLLNKKRADIGFTLIELLVVIAIIGVLSSIVLASLNNARQKSRDVRRISDLKQIQLALELYFDANSKYPVASAGCDASTDNGLEVMEGTQIPQVPRDAGSSDTCYRYATVKDDTKPTTYHLGGRLEDKKQGALKTDADFDSTAYTNGFHGQSETTTGQCDGTKADPVEDETCYDVRP